MTYYQVLLWLQWHLVLLDLTEVMMNLCHIMLVNSYFFTHMHAHTHTHTHTIGKTTNITVLKDTY